MAAAVKLFHLAALGLYIHVSHFLYANAVTNSNSPDKSQQQVAQVSNRFLTNWTYVVQLIYFTCCVLAYFFDIIPVTRKLTSSLNAVANDLFTTLVTPIGFMVSLVFWCLYAIDRELVYPKFLDQTIPVYINQAIHTFNSLIPIVDMFLVNHAFPSWIKALKVITLYLGAYSVCLVGTYFEKGIWVYPFLKELTWPQIGIFGVANLLFAYVLYAVAKMLSHMLWKDVKPQHTKLKKSNKQKSKKSA